MLCNKVLFQKLKNQTKSDTPHVLKKTVKKKACDVINIMSINILTSI